MARASFSSPVDSISGRIQGSNLVFYTRSGRALVRAYSHSSRPTSIHQAASRSYLMTSARQWGGLSQSQRDGWLAYAAHHRFNHHSSAHRSLTGFQVFCIASFYLLSQRKPIRQDPPEAAPPAPYSSITSSPTDHPRALILGGTHGNVDTFGKILMVRISPGYRIGRTPSDSALRLLAGFSPYSFLILPWSGSEAWFSDAQFPIYHGSQFRVQFTVLTAEGIPSPSFAQDFVREVC